MLRYMLDTNICIATIRTKPDAIRVAFNRHHAQLCISTITAMELMYGVEVSSQPRRNPANVEGFIARLDALDYGAPAAAHTAQIRAESTMAGAPIGP